MSALALQVTDVGPMMRELDELVHDAIKNKTYQATPLGRRVRRWLAALQYEGSPETTRNSYETTLARFALDFSDFDGPERFCERDGVPYLRDFLSRHWGEASLETRRQRLMALRSYFEWEMDESDLPYNPARRIKPPRARDTLRIARQRAEIRQLLRGQDVLRDRCGLGLMCALALRKNDLRMLRVGEIDLVRNLVWLLNRKGEDNIYLPLEHGDLRDDLYLHLQAERRAADEFLIYPKTHRLRPMEPSAFHRWFKRCLLKADLPDFPMHELRHTAGDDMWRTTGDLFQANRLLGHKSLEHTRRYLHPTPDDLRAGLRLVARSWAEEEG